jgi:hypothetical protein
MCVGWTHAPRQTAPVATLEGARSNASPQPGGMIDTAADVHRGAEKRGGVAGGSRRLAVRWCQRLYKPAAKSSGHHRLVPRRVKSIARDRR